MIHTSLQYIKKHKIFAVIRTDQQEKALKTSFALLESGINIVEISLLTSKAIDVISHLSKKGVFVGAGTVMNDDMAKEVIDAGAKFIVSPYINKNIIETAIKNNIFVSSGCVTPNEIMNAYQLGVHLIKIFPAHGFGGVKYLKSLIDIFPHIPFMPTGGVNLDNVSEYFKIGVTAVGISTALMPSNLVDEHRFNEIKNIASQYIDKIF